MDRALSEFDERNKVVAAGVINSPWKNPFLAGFQFSPVFQYHSGHPFNLLAGGEVNGDNHTTNERPIGAPRDTGLGPNYVDFDARLTWQHKVGEHANLILTAEGFNIANHTNYGSVNNEVSPLFGFAARVHHVQRAWQRRSLSQHAARIHFGTAEAGDSARCAIEFLIARQKIAGSSRYSRRRRSLLNFRRIISPEPRVPRTSQQ